MPTITKTKKAKSSAVVLHCVEYTHNPASSKGIFWSDVPRNYGGAQDDTIEYEGKCAFLTGKAAAERAANTKAEAATDGNRTLRTRIVRVEPEPEFLKVIEGLNTWKEREAKRLVDGTYTKLPWADEDWYKANNHCVSFHFAHVSQTNTSNIAYTENNDKGALDRQTQTKPGRYLTCYFPELASSFQDAGRNDVYGRPVRQSKLEYWLQRYEDLYGTGVEIKFAHTADEMEYVYRNGPSSCMGGEEGAHKFDKQTHPARVYAAGDLHLAYLVVAGENQDSEPRITARALVWPEKKCYGRAYGDDHKLNRELGKLGYFREHLIGARLFKIKYKNHRDEFIMPYIDDTGAVSDHGKYFIIDEANTADYEAGRTDGLMCTSDDAHTGLVCERCGEPMADDGATRVNGEGLWCAHCATDNVFYCVVTDTYYRDDDRHPPIILHNGDHVHESQRDDLAICAVTGEYYRYADNGTFLADGSWVSAEGYSAIAYAKDTEDWHLKTDLTEIDGKWYSVALPQEVLDEAKANEVAA